MEKEIDWFSKFKEAVKNAQYWENEFNKKDIENRKNKSKLTLYKQAFRGSCESLAGDVADDEDFEMYVKMIKDYYLMDAKDKLCRK